MTLYRWVRVLAALAILAAMAAFGALLAPVYYRNLRFTQALREIASGPEVAADSALRQAVLDRAARFGLPVREGDISVRRSRQRVRIQVDYKVPVELPVYSVNLHFHPVGGK